MHGGKIQKRGSLAPPRGTQAGGRGQEFAYRLAHGFETVPTERVVNPAALTAGRQKPMTTILSRELPRSVSPNTRGPGGRRGVTLKQHSTVPTVIIATILSLAGPVAAGADVSPDKAFTKRHQQLVKIVDKNTGFAHFTRGMNAGTIHALRSAVSESDIPVLRAMLEDKDTIVASVDTLNPASCGRVKTGQWGERPKHESVLPHRHVRTQGRRRRHEAAGRREPMGVQT